MSDQRIIAPGEYQLKEFQEAEVSSRLTRRDVLKFARTAAEQNEEAREAIQHHSNHLKRLEGLMLGAEVDDPNDSETDPEKKKKVKVPGALERVERVEAAVFGSYATGNEEDGPGLVLWAQAWSRERHALRSSLWKRLIWLVTGRVELGD